MGQSAEVIALEEEILWFLEYELGNVERKGWERHYLGETCSLATAWSSLDKC